MARFNAARHNAVCLAEANRKAFHVEVPAPTSEFEVNHPVQLRSTSVGGEVLRLSVTEAFELFNDLHKVCGFKLK